MMTMVVAAGSVGFLSPGKSAHLKKATSSVKTGKSRGSGSETKRPAGWDDKFREELSKTLAFLFDGEVASNGNELTL